jgi:integrase/recombinase XerD
MKRKGTKKQNVVLREKQLADGTLSLYLDIYRSGKRTYEFLKLYVNPKARTPIERQANKETYQLADDIRLKRESEINHGEFGFVAPHRKKIDFMLFYRDYVDNYTKKDHRMMKGALNAFTAFLQTKGINPGKSLEPKKITPDLIKGFADYLEDTFKGETPHSYLKRFKKAMRYATNQNLFTKNPADDISIAESGGIKKQILSLDEVKTLNGTPYTNENIRRAFLFSSLTGLRFCDVNQITFANIDFSNKLLAMEQQKVKGKSKQVTIPLNVTALNLIGTPGETDQKVFSLPSFTACLKDLRQWCKRAGINKRITWHSARHSFAVNLLSGGANVKTVSDLLGHASLKNTQKYLHVVDKQKTEAVNLIEL